MALWPGFAVVYKNDDVTQRDIDRTLFNSLGINYLRSNENSAVYWCDQGFQVDWGPSYGPQINTQAALQDYHDHILSEAALWNAKSKQLWSFEIGNELETQIDGTIITIKGFHDMVRQTAQDVKNLYPNIGKISYHCYNRIISNAVVGNEYGTYDEFTVNGLGAIDLIAIHPYGYIGSNVIQDGGMAEIERIVNKFGDRCYVSEFNLDALGSNATSILTATGLEAMNHYYKDYLLKILGPYNSKVFVYLWNGNVSDQPFSLRETNGHYLSHVASFFNAPHVPRTLVT